MKQTATLFYTALFCLGSVISASAQTSSANLLYNNGDQIYVQSGAVLHVQGDYVNSSGTTTNNGLINVEGDVTNGGTFTYSGSGEQTLRLIGNSYLAGSAASGEQKISGFNSSNPLYNLVIDRGTTQVVRMASDMQINGSLVWNAATTTAATYSPSTYSTTIGNSTLMQIRTGSSTFVTATGGGHIKTYDAGATTDYEVFVNNGSYNAIAGYQTITAYSFTGSRAVTAKDGYIETRSNAAASKGLSRVINTAGTPSTSTYVFPVGGVTATYNPIKVYFKTLTGTIKLSSKFTDDAVASLSSGGFYNHFDKGNSTGQATTIDSIAHPLDYTNNPGYNVFQVSACGGSLGNWFIMNKASLKNHGYWSFNPTTLSGSPAYTYTVEAYPHGYSEYTGVTIDPVKRIVRENTDAFTSAPSAANFQNQIMQVASASDIITYSYYKNHKNFTACNDGADGITGGVYSSFSHFGVGTDASPSGNALPVKLIDITATPIDNSYIRVDWATASEIDNKGFQVLRSDDGVNFTNVGWVDGHGTTSQQINYSFDDHTVLPGVVYYYRLNQVDFDGRGTLTDIVSAEITDGPSLVISELIPNPTAANARIVISTSDAVPAQIKFYDILGKEILSNDYQLTYGTNSIDLQSSNLANATYTVIIKVGNKFFTKKLVVVK